MNFTRKELTEGVYLNVINTDKFKDNYLSVNFLAPLKKETAAMNALIPLILTRGSVNYPTMEKMSGALDMLYASSINTDCRSEAEVQKFGLYCSILGNSYAPDGTDIMGGTLDILHDVIFNPYLVDGLFDEEYLETEKANLCDRIASKINNKTSYAISKAVEVMCENEAYGIGAIGEIDTVNAVTSKELYDQYKYVIANANVEIYFVGNCDSETEEKLVRCLDFAPRKCEIIETQVIRKADKVKEFTEEQKVAQGKLTLGFRTNKVLSDGDFYKMVVFNEILGASPTSKLFMNVREKHSLCYYCRSIVRANKGIMLIASGIEVENKEKTQNEILKQLDEIKQGNITDEEMFSAKQSIYNGYKSIDDSQSRMEYWYANRLYAGLHEEPEEVAKKVETVTKEDVMEIANGITLDTVYFLKGTLNGGKNE